MNQHLMVCTKCNKVYESKKIEDLAKYFHEIEESKGQLRTTCINCFNSNNEKTITKDNK